MENTFEMDKPTSCRHAQTPPSSPYLSPFTQLISIQDLQEVLVNLIQTVGKSSDSVNASESLDEQTSPEPNKPRMRASKLDFKAVEEVWDANEYKYKIIESAAPTKVVAELGQYVFVVRKRFDRYTLEPSTYLDINSESLRDILRTILGKVKGLDLREDKLSIERNVLFHFLDDLQAYQSNVKHEIQNEEAAPHHLSLLLDFMEDTYKSTKQHLDALLKHQEITYDLLWALFPPNALVYTTCRGTKKPQCVRFDFGEEKKLRSGLIYYSMHCRYLDFDGKTFGDVSTEVGIFKFRGAEPIQNLTSYPLQYHPNRSELTAGLADCGRKFITLMGGSHRHCCGTAYYMQDDVPIQVSVDSRVVIDPAFFHKINPNYSRPRVSEKAEKNSSVIDLFNDDSTKRTDEVTSNGRKPTKLTNDELLICCPTVAGFSLEDKLWLEFAVADIEEIEWSTSSFDCLKIAKDKKDIILAMAEARTGRSAGHAFDDIVIGKGRGLNVLLHGPPGVGKTLTAEAVSEHLHKPLYSISAGELELDAAKLEKQLSVIFQIANQWGAILLLDEADVFLEKRSSQNLQRNGLVAVFLRKLEYCMGILFLTTNRVSEFDDAILSRIHLPLRYTDLNHDDRRAVWLNTLKRANTLQGCVRVSKKELDSLVDVKLNGRQIKNVVAAAHALATQRRVSPTYAQLYQAINASKDFIDEFYGAPKSLYN